MLEQTDPWWHLWQYEEKPKSQHKQRDTRCILINAAFQEIHRVGFNKASLKNMLDQTDLTKGALYHHFPNKKALGYAIVNEILRGYMKSIGFNRLPNPTTQSKH